MTNPAYTVRYHRHMCGPVHPVCLELPLPGGPTDQVHPVCLEIPLPGGPTDQVHPVCLEIPLPGGPTDQVQCTPFKCNAPDRGRDGP